MGYYCVPRCTRPTSNTGIDQTRIDFLAIIVTQAHGRKLPGNVILHENVAFSRQLVEDVDARGILEGQTQGLLVPIHLWRG